VEEKSEKKRCQHLEAFAMLGALAWQAATLIKMFICLGGRSHGVYLVLAPGSPPCVLVCSFVCTSRPIRLHRTTFYRRESIMEPPTKDQSLNSCMWVCNGTQMKLSTICPRTCGTLSWELRRLNGELFWRPGELK